MVARKHKLCICFGLAGVFVLGAIAGVFATGGYLHHQLRGLHGHGPEAIHNLGVKWIDWELDLDGPQKVELERILEDVHLDLFRFKTEHSDELAAIIEPGLERIDALLTPAQAERWAPLRARLVDHLEARLKEE